MGTTKPTRPAFAVFVVLEHLGGFECAGIWEERTKFWSGKSRKLFRSDEAIREHRFRYKNSTFSDATRIVVVVTIFVPVRVVRFRNCW